MKRCPLRLRAYNSRKTEESGGKEFKRSCSEPGEVILNSVTKQENLKIIKKKRGLEQRER